MNAGIENEYTPTEVTPPGCTLEEALEERGMSQAELAERTGRPKKTINEIVKGQAAITPETAIQLERVLGVPASFWNTRQRQYEESVARAQSLSRLLEHIDWPKKFPVSQMMKLGWIPKSDSPMEKLESLLRFFRIGSPDEWQKMVMAPRMGTAFRKSASFKTNPYSLTAWLQKGEREASAMQCRPFDKRGFEVALGSSRELVQELPEGFDRLLSQKCANTGVAVVFVPLIKGVHASGATRWLRSDRAMILLSLRGKYEDIFWFSFYHEAAHILLHGKREVFVEEPGRLDAAAESEADDFARDFLITPKLWEEFVAQSSLFSTAVVEAFARRARVPPAVIVGRLQHEGRIERSQLNGLKRKIDFAYGMDV